MASTSMSIAPARTIPLTNPPASCAGTRIGAAARSDSSARAAAGSAARRITWSSVSRMRRTLRLGGHEPLPARPYRPGAAGDDARALLRPRLRVRDHAGLASAARAPELGGRGAVGVRAARGLVVVELHDLGHQRARPRLDRRADAADRADARVVPDGGGDPRRVRPPGAAVRRLVLGDPARPPLVSDLRRGRARDRRARAR